MVRMSSARLDMENARIDQAVFKDYAEKVVTENSGTAYAIDISAGNVFKITLTADCAFTFSNAFPSGNACAVTLLLKQDGAGSRTATWPTLIWPAATTPVLSVTPGRTDVLYFFTVDGGSQWFGQLIARNFFS